MSTAASTPDIRGEHLDRPAPAPAAARPDRAPDDLSMNETPYPPLPSLVRLVEQGARQLNRYPDHTAGRLVAALARRLQVSPAEVVVGPGSAGLCQHLIQAIGTLDPGRSEVVHAELSFEAYPVIIRNAGATAVPVPLAGYRHDLPGMAAALTDSTRCVLVCSPNNPTGAAVHRDEIEAFLDRVPAHVPVILDEAYREFVTDPQVPDGMDLFRARDNVCVLRTFSKAYGLAALRVGYAAVPARLAAPARMVGAVFFPGSLGQVAALGCLDAAATAEVTGRCAQLVAARTRLRAALLALGLPVAPSEANFVWLPLGEQAQAFAEWCRQAGVLVRAIPGCGVRVTVGTDSANERLCAVARGFRPGEPSTGR